MSSWRGAASRPSGGGARGESRFSRPAGGYSAFGGSRGGGRGRDADPVSESKNAFSSSPKPAAVGGGSRFGGKGEGAGWGGRSRPAGRQEAPAAFQTRGPGPASDPAPGGYFEKSSAFGGSRRSGDDAAPQSSAFGGRRAKDGEGGGAFGRRPEESSTAFGGRGPRRDTPGAGPGSSGFGRRPQGDGPATSGTFSRRPADSGSSAFGSRSGRPGDSGGAFGRRPPQDPQAASIFGSSRPAARHGAPDAGGLFGGGRRPQQDSGSSVFGSSKSGGGYDSGSAAFGSSKLGGGGGRLGAGKTGVPDEVVEEVRQVAVPKALQNAQKYAGASASDVSVQKGPAADKALLEQAAMLSPSVAVSTLKASVEGMLRDLATAMDVDGAVRHIVDAARNSGMLEFHSELVRMAVRFAATAESAATRVRAAQLLRVLLEGASAEERAAARRAERRAKKSGKKGKGAGGADRALSKEQMEPMVNLVQLCTGVESVAAYIEEGSAGGRGGAASGAGEDAAAGSKLQLAETLALLVADGVIDRRGVPSEGTRELLKLAGVRGVIDPAVAAASGIDSASPEQVARETVDAPARGKEALAGLQERLARYEAAGFVFEEPEIAGALMRVAAQKALTTGELTLKAPWLGEDQLGPIFEELLWEKPASASAALHALQGVLHSADFPPQVLEGTMLMLYREEVIEDKDFLEWASDTADETPGKDRALAQLPRFLQMVRDDMEEEEEDEEEDGGGSDGSEEDDEDDE